MPMPKSRRSGGPRTAAGLAAVAGNALRTGAYSANVVLPGDDPAQFQELVQQFAHDFAPADVAESALVHQLAVLTWKKLRLDRIEHSHFLLKLGTDRTEFEINPVLYLLPPVGALHWVNAQHHNTPAERDALVANLQAAARWQTVPNGGYPLDTLEQVRQQAPALYQHVAFEANEYNTPIPVSGWLTQQASDAQGRDGIVFTLGCMSYLELHEGWEWLAQHRDDFEEALRRLQENRILVSMQQSTVNRIHDDLDRAFQRALSELRRQQNWRRDRATVAIEPHQAAPPI